MTANDSAPGQILFGLLQGRMLSKAVSVAADLAVADHMTATPMSIETIATATGANTDGLYRLLRALATVGVFAESPGRMFALTPVSELLRSNSSMRAMARWVNDSSNYLACSELGYSVLTGKPAFDKVHGEPVFDYLGKHPQVSQIFDEAMTHLTAGPARSIASGYDFSQIRHLVDIGGGHGALLMAVADRFPNLRATLLDLPYVIEKAKVALASGPYRDRIEAVGENFLEGVTTGADGYIMKHILHGCDDEQSLKLLTSCRKAMTDGGCVLLVEGIVSDAPGAGHTKLFDLEMLVSTGGRERTEAEFAVLLDKAGLKLTRNVVIDPGTTIIEARAS